MAPPVAVVRWVSDMLAQPEREAIAMAAAESEAKVYFIMRGSSL
jgi:hypothetical protein